MINDLSDVPNVALRIVSVVQACLAQTPLGAPAQVGLYHTVPPDDCCDFALVWLDKIVPTKSFRTQEFNRFQDCSTVHPFVRFGIRVVRNCWPRITRGDDVASSLPAREAIDPVAANLMMEGVMLECCLMSDLASSNGVIMQGDCDGYWVSEATPRPPRGGCAGWTIYVEIDLGLPCCLPAS